MPQIEIIFLIRLPGLRPTTRFCPQRVFGLLFFTGNDLSLGDQGISLALQFGLQSKSFLSGENGQPHALATQTIAT